jgi:hypothetical protein
MKAGDKIGNFELIEEIKTINDFILQLDNAPSLFWRFKVMPTAFFHSWHLRQIRIDIRSGLFWIVKRIDSEPLQN